MGYVVSKIFFAILISGTILTVVACGSAAPGQDIPPMSPIEAQSSPEAEVIEEPEPTATLPTEIVEPVSPVSPEAAPPMAAPPPEGVQPVPGSEAALAAAMVHLAQQTGLPADQITLVSVQGMEWSDASLGCPQEGMMYAQVITSGYLIVLEAGGQQYEYHSDQAGNVVLCQK